jgi:hypothetical protein
LATAFAGQAQVLLASDWRVAEPLIQEALRIAPANALAKSLRPSVLLAKRMESVDKCVSQARELQAAGDISGALAAVQEGLASYPNDSRLVQLQNALRGTIAEQTYLRRRQDLEELRQLSPEVEAARDETSLTALLDRSVVLSSRAPSPTSRSGRKAIAPASKPMWPPRKTPQRRRRFPASRTLCRFLQVKASRSTGGCVLEIL